MRSILIEEYKFSKWRERIESGTAAREENRAGTGSTEMYAQLRHCISYWETAGIIKRLGQAGGGGPDRRGELGYMLERFQDRASGAHRNPHTNMTDAELQLLSTGRDPIFFERVRSCLVIRQHRQCPCVV